MSMSKFATTSEYWRAEAVKYARALVDIMDGIPDHDIQGETGLDESGCGRIAEARAAAISLLSAQE